MKGGEYFEYHDLGFREFIPVADKGEVDAIGKIVRLNKIAYRQLALEGLTVDFTSRKSLSQGVSLYATMPDKHTTPRRGYPPNFQTAIVEIDHPDYPRGINQFGFSPAVFSSPAQPEPYTVSIQYEKGSREKGEGWYCLDVYDPVTQETNFVTQENDGFFYISPWRYIVDLRPKVTFANDSFQLTHNGKKKYSAYIIPNAMLRDAFGDISLGDLRQVLKIGTTERAALVLPLQTGEELTLVTDSEGTISYVIPPPAIPPLIRPPVTYPQSQPIRSQIEFHPIHRNGKGVQGPNGPERILEKGDRFTLGKVTDPKLQEDPPFVGIQVCQDPFSLRKLAVALYAFHPPKIDQPM